MLFGVLVDIGAFLLIYYLGGFGGGPVAKFTWFVSITSFLSGKRKKWFPLLNMNLRP